MAIDICYSIDRGFINICTTLYVEITTDTYFMYNIGLCNIKA